MTSKTSSKILTEALTSRQWIDPLQSTVDVNVTDGLFAIANAINRLAASHEHGQERADRIMADQFRGMGIDGEDPAAGNA
jgi:hypothetical protein